MAGVRASRQLTLLVVLITAVCVWFPFGLVVRIPGFHPGGPGSIPGMGSYLFFSPSSCSSNYCT